MRRFLHKAMGHVVPSHRNAYRPHLLKKPWLIFFLTMALTSEGVLVGGTLLKQSGTAFLAAVVPGEVIALTNTERAASDLKSVAENPLLSSAAQAKAEDMAQAGYFSHVGPDGKEPWAWIQEAGYSYTYAGENLAVRFTDSKDVVEAWMASPTHRANIVKPVYTDIGVGVADGMYEGRPATYVVQYFGTPRTAASPAAVAAVPPVPVQEVQQEPEVPAAPVLASAQVEGAATAVPDAPVSAVAQSGDSLQSYGRALMEGLARSGPPALWVIGGVAAVVLLALLLAFLIHIQVQPTDLLMSGAVVAAIAVSLFVIDARYLPSIGSSQGAAVGMTLSPSTGVLDPGAAQSESFPL